MTQDIITDGDGITLHEGDRVYTHDIFLATRVYGTLVKNDETHPYEWSVEYDDNQSFVVLDFNQLYKA